MRDAETRWLHEQLWEVATSGVVFEDERIKYVEVQIDRNTWRELQEWAATGKPAFDEARHRQGELRDGSRIEDGEVYPTKRAFDEDRQP